MYVFGRWFVMSSIISNLIVIDAIYKNGFNLVMIIRLE